MANLVVLSWNIQGINNRVKRVSCLDIVGRKEADIVMLQETHIKEQDIHSVGNNTYKVVSFSSANNKTKGVIILSRINLKMHIFDKGNDEEGRIAYIKGFIVV